MDGFRSKTALRQQVNKWKRAGLTVGFVPTMGALHAGHLSLMTRAREECHKLVASIYVNPTQFDRKADLDSYPLDLEADIAKLKDVPCDALFTISNKDMYAADSSTWVVPDEQLVSGLCGRTRGSHFRGVTTIVAKLFNIVGAQRAYFGQKDYQQFAIIKRMVRDLDIPIEVLSCPTVREGDGLALSSRNRLLGRENRRLALAIPRSLSWAVEQYSSGKTKSADIVRAMTEQLEKAGATVDYIEAVDSANLSPKAELDEHTVIALAAFFGAVRLIDNHCLKQEFPVSFDERP
jgi:pantoate--beta-alanine ligase